MKFCLGASLNFGHLPSPAPYTSLIIQANFDRLSFNIPVCMKQETIESSDLRHEVSRKQNAVTFFESFIIMCIVQLFCFVFLSCLGFVRSIT